MENFFRERRESSRKAELVAQRRFNRIAIARLLTFIVMAGALWAWNKSALIYWPVAAFAALVVFLWLMSRQEAARRERDFQRNIQKINEDEEGRLSFVFARDDTGELYLEKNHAFAADLDIFGKHSLYRLLNRTCTAEGSARLADWLVRPAPLEQVLMRQEAVLESKPHHEWREKWQGTAMLHEHAAQHIGALRTWIKTPLEDSLKKGLKWKWWAGVTIALLVLWIIGVLPGWPLGFSLAAHLLILKRYSKTVQALTGETYQLGKTLVAYADLLVVAESMPFQKTWWQAHSGRRQAPAKALRQLGSWFNRLDFRNNAFFMLFTGIPFLWDLVCLEALERWKEKYKDDFEHWINGLAAIEAMNSLAGYAFADPDLTMPQVVWAEAPEIRAVGMGHPLIPSGKRVSNDFDLKGKGQTILITGSNMSGKSTFLRTVGLNLALAQAGSAVPATRFTCSQLRVFSSMRTQDSLEESTSSFYAELKRLRQLLELAGTPGGLPVFYLLDEILKGTNSSDRHRGAAALIRQLHPLAASGMVSTHDLELGEWGAQQDYVRNFHFRSELEEGRLSFDYRLREGICRSFNASELMRMMGIDINGNGEK